MILQYGQEGFNDEWLNLLENDPVHPTISLEKRITGNRTVFVYVHENIPQFMVCVRIGNRLPRNMMEVLNEDGYKSKYDITYAIFYSIFRSPQATLKGAGLLAIKSLIAHCRKLGIVNFFTLSPIPSMKSYFNSKPDESLVRQYLESWEGAVARFHLSNGAKIHSINFDADYSEQRLNESWGVMVNYDYNNSDQISKE